MSLLIKDYSELFFQRFQQLNNKTNPLPIEILEFWLNNYIKETDIQLLQIIQKSYEKYGMTLYDYPLKQVFPYFVNDISKMRLAAQNLRTVLKRVKGEINNIVQSIDDIYLIIFVGAGTGAGHVTTFNGFPAILFGLENIARLGWFNTSEIEGLLYHELGHVIHKLRRKAVGRADKVDKVWYRLYLEGVAQRFEQQFRGDSSWHMQSQDWEKWINDNYQRIAQVFHDRINLEDRQASDLFGSNVDDPQCNFEGQVQVGYFVGAKMVKEWEEDLSMTDIMQIPELEVKKKVIDYLKKYSEG